MAGRDAVIAAETGSGKTLAYLLPIVSRMLALRQGGDGGSASPDGEQRSGCARPAGASCSGVIAGSGTSGAPASTHVNKLTCSWARSGSKWSALMTRMSRDAARSWAVAS